LPGLTSSIPILPLTKDQNGTSLSMITAIQPIYEGGRILNGNKLADKYLNDVQNKLRIVINDVIVKSESKFRQLQVLNETLQTLEAYQKVMDSLFEQVSQAYQQGIASKTDVLRVKLKKRKIVVQKQNLNKLIKIAYKDLKIYAGLDGNVELNLVYEDEKVKEPVYDIKNLENALSSRAEYKLLQSDVEKAHIQRNLEQGKYLPSVMIGAIIYRADYFHNNSFSQNSNYSDTAAFGMIAIPISDWWEASHKLKEMKLKEEAVLEKLDSVSDYLLLDMQNKLVNYETSYEKIILAEIEIEQAEANKSEIEDGYNNGTEKLSDYLEALVLIHESQTNMTKAKADFFKSRTDFLLTVGATTLNN
jgi:outer membrane protein TolC